MKMTNELQQELINKIDKMTDEEILQVLISDKINLPSELKVYEVKKMT